MAKHGLAFALPEGLMALPRLRRAAGGELAPARDRRRRQKLEEVEIVAAAPAAAVELDEADERFLLGAKRRSWPAIERRFGERALERAYEFARLGAVRLRCRVSDDLRLERPYAWLLSPEWVARHEHEQQARAGERARWRERAAAAAAAVAALSPELAAALRASQPLNRILPLLVHAAEDLVAGHVHDGPRAFSQRHFGHTKARDDVARILREAGVSSELMARLGVRRSGRIGVAGPIRVTTPRGSYSASALDGPQLLRTDQPGLVLELEREAILVVIENLQAAETIADRRPELALVYGAGYGGPAALRLIGGLAAHAARVLLVPDADADGVAIAARWLEAAPKAEVVDIGLVEHEPTQALDGRAVARLQRQRDAPVGALAQAVLERGYPLEEEMLVVRAVDWALRGWVVEMV